MSRRQQLVWILLLVTGIASAASHLVVRAFGIQTSPVLREQTGLSNGSEWMCVAGSSLMFYGLDWARIGKEVGFRLERCGVPAASPSELEQICASITNARVMVLGVSFYDLNEYFLSDFRAHAVPMTTTLRDLHASSADWHFSKRIISQYPLTWMHKLFPSAGRSMHVMVGVRALARRWAGSKSDSEGGLAFSPQAVTSERIDDWPGARTLRNLSQLRIACQGRSAFNGPKRSALSRLLQRATQQGRVMVVVLPVSQPFAQEFMNEAATREFEGALEAMRDAFPNVSWLRVDQLPQLRSGQYYWDLVHLNGQGQSIATEAVLVSLRKLLGKE